MQHRFIHANGLRFHIVEAGEGPLVLLLHGFPEFWYSWRHQIPALSPHFHVVAPDLRGYNLSDKPARGYAIADFIADVEGLIQALGYDRCFLVGHDWGGVIAWQVAMQKPALVEQLAVLNCPHPARFVQCMAQPRQLLRSSYIFFFQLPTLPEWILSRDDFEPLVSKFRTWATHPEYFSDADLEEYRRALAQPGALTAALNYYRNLRPSKAGFDTIHAPTLLIWGEQDRALGKETTYGTRRWVPDLRVHYLGDASHWVQQDAPDEVNRLLLEFFITSVGIKHRES